MNQTAKHATQGRHPQKSARANDATALLPSKLLQSFLFTLALGVALLLILSLIAYFCADPLSLIRPLALTGAALTALAGGFLTVRVNGHSALLCGLINGSLLTLLMLILSLFFGDVASGYSTPVSALLHIAFLLLSVAGAFLGLKKPHKKRKRR